MRNPLQVLAKSGQPCPKFGQVWVAPFPINHSPHIILISEWSLRTIICTISHCRFPIPPTMLNDGEVSSHHFTIRWWWLPYAPILHRWLSDGDDGCGWLWRHIWMRTWLWRPRWWTTRTSWLVIWWGIAYCLEIMLYLPAMSRWVSWTVS